MSLLVTFVIRIWWLIYVDSGQVGEAEARVLQYEALLDKQRQELLA